MIITSIINFYREGFKQISPSGKGLWLIIMIKLFIMFPILKVFYFQDFLSKFHTEEEKIEHITNELTNIK